MIETIQNLYLKRINHFSEELKSLDSKIKVISYLRLTIALTAVVTFYFALTLNPYLFYVISFFVVVFTTLIFIHTKLFKKRNLAQNFIQINKEELRYLEHDYSGFDEGKEFIDPNHSYTYDLDIFGKGSLYQSISRSVTYKGKIILAQSLSQPVLSHSDILSKQHSIKELKDLLDFRQEFQATGLLLKETSTDREKLKNWLSENFHFINQKLFPYILYILPAIALVFLTISLIQWEVHPALTATIICNWIVFGLNSKKINRLHFLISKKKNVLENFSDLFKIAHKEKFKTKELEELRDSMKDASEQFKQLSNYVGWFDQRLNILIIPFLNTLFLYDLQCCYLIEKWRMRNDNKVIPWLDTLGTLDFFCSLANFSYNNPTYNFPELSSANTLSVEAMEMSHPLIKIKKRVPNSFVLGIENQTAIITGANMAGKSTFLRTIGINIVLAYTGAPVCATYFKTSLLELASSMRISDSLTDETSYFYAELQKLKSIRQKVESTKPILVLLDEMLRGTNSKDKQQGSKAFVEGLLKYPSLVLVATHDLSLGLLEDEYPSKIKNFCFESFLQKNELYFDYKIRQGVAQNTNASFLMKTLGII